MYTVNNCSVMQVQCLDENGYWIKRSVFVVSDDFNEFFKIYQKKIKNTCVDSYTTFRRVLYV